MSNAITKLIEQKAEELRLVLDTIADQKKVEEALKAELSELIAALPDSPTTYKVEWAQLQNVTLREWAYRDSAVTAAQKEVAKAEKRLSYVKRLLKGAQDAAKAAKKAKVAKETVSLRVVRGKAGTPKQEEANSSPSQRTMAGWWGPESSGEFYLSRGDSFESDSLF